MSRFFPILIAVYSTVLLGGCSFFGMEDRDDGSANAGEVPALTGLPNTSPSLRGKGPLVPGTTGLHVTSGYFSRARMGAVDLLLGYTLASFLRGDEEAYLRLEAHGDKIGPSQTVFHALIPLSVALDANVETLANLTLEKEALQDAKANIRVAARSKRHNRLVEIHRVSFEVVEPHIITGTLEGTTKRGSRATSSLPFKLGFVAYRGPDMGMVGPPRASEDGSGEGAP